jgi:hypothetical protein
VKGEPPETTGASFPTASPEGRSPEVPEGIFRDAFGPWDVYLNRIKADTVRLTWGTLG